MVTKNTPRAVPNASGTGKGKTLSRGSNKNEALTDDGNGQAGSSLDPEDKSPGSKKQCELGVSNNRLLVTKEICEEISSLLVHGISTEQSKQTSKEFPLSFEEQGFSLMQPKLDGFMSRRAREKGFLKIVTAREEAHVKTQLKIMDIGLPLIDLYSRITDLVEKSPEAKRDLAVAAVARGRRNPFRSTRRGQSNEPPARQSQYFEYQHGERERGRGRKTLSDHRGPRGRGASGRRYESSPLFPP